MTNKEAVAKLQAAADIALAAGCELAKIPARDALLIADLLEEYQTHERTRILTLDEVLQTKQDPVYLIIGDTGDWAMYEARVGYRHETIFRQGSQLVDLYDDEYGQSWCVWNGKPSDSQLLEYYANQEAAHDET